jgi:hypothetical protein
MPRHRTLFALALVAAGLLFFAGCYSTQYPLGSPDKAAIDPAYVGDFAVTENNQNETIVIRNLDDHAYYVEYDEPGKAPLRMVGYTADVSGVTFANLRSLTDDGSIDSNYLLMRIAISPDRGKLSMRNLKDDFFKGKTINSSDDLQKIIAANLDNDLMYDGPATNAMRVTPPANPTTAGSHF